MLNFDVKRKINTLRDILVGKVPDPKAQVEQITIALIYKFMDDMDLQAIIILFDVSPSWLRKWKWVIGLCSNRPFIQVRRHNVVSTNDIIISILVSILYLSILPFQLVIFPMNYFSVKEVIYSRSLKKACVLTSFAK